MTSYEILTTEDGSPTLATRYVNDMAEVMHHMGGALTETIYVYKPAIEWALEHGSEVMSLGLGLGYNELLSAAVARSRELPLRLTSFEISPVLREEFLSWLKGDSSQWTLAYDLIARQMAEALGFLPEELKQTLRRWWASGQWQLLGEFPQSLPPDRRFNAILYDAFSKKMDSPLWSEEVLAPFLQGHAASDCALATYAATGVLKKCLKEQGFTIHEKAGFKGKRECTFATRSPSF